MNNFIKPKTFQSDVQSLLDSADKKGLFFHGIIFNGENIAVFSPNDGAEWQAKLTAVLIHDLAENNGSNPDAFIDSILAEVAKLKED